MDLGCRRGCLGCRGLDLGLHSIPIASRIEENTLHCSQRDGQRGGKYSKSIDRIPGNCR